MSEYPEGHPLHDVPQAILEAARAVLAGAALEKDVDPDAADPIADAVVIQLLPWLTFDADERIHPMAKLAVRQERQELGLDAGTMDVIFLRDGTGMQIHGEARCAGAPCPFHNPSDHPLREAPLAWFKELNLMMRQCEHGSLHPDPDSMLHLRFRTFYDGWHPCCEQQCCLPAAERGH